MSGGVSGQRKKALRRGVGALSALEDLRPLYFLPEDPLAEEVLIPGFSVADSVDCMVGFFSSEVLRSLAPGLATYINLSSDSFRLVISPLIRKPDHAAITQAEIEQTLEELVVTQDLLEQHTLKCLTYLLRTGRIEIKIALMSDGLFHPKVWLFQNGSDVIAAHGSSNVTYAGIKKNVEQIAVSKAWEDPNQRYIVEKLAYRFKRLWENKEDSCVVIPLPKAVRERLLKTYGSDRVPTEDDLRELYKRATAPAAAEVSPVAVTAVGFSIPQDLRFDDGPFAHQGNAARAWCEAGYRGILEMATGSGKTITSMLCAHRLFEQHKPLLIVVAAPYVPLIQQWCDEILPFGLNPINLTISGNAQKRSAELQQIRRRLRTGISEAEAVVVSHDTLCSPEFHDAVRQFECAKLLIGDEAHNLGREQFIANPPDLFEYRLGLSATPVRQYDDVGTDALLSYFGPVAFRFTLEEAIGRCLVEYDYFLHPISLTEAEMHEWYDLTGKIKQNAWRSGGGKPDDYLAKLLRDRRALLETAEGKLVELQRLFAEIDVSQLKHTLIYATDKQPEQLEAVNKLLQQRNILFHQLTADETSDREETRRIIRSFQDAEIQVLTAKRVLDEGVNIPQINRAYILASTTVERQWVQRRGRLLRTCSATGKTHSTIHDFLALPPDIGGSLDDDAKSLVKGELKRAQEFARLARNAGRPDGPLNIIDKLVDAAFL